MLRFEKFCFGLVYMFFVLFLSFILGNIVGLEFVWLVGGMILSFRLVCGLFVG